MLGGLFMVVFFFLVVYVLVIDFVLGRDFGRFFVYLVLNIFNFGVSYYVFCFGVMVNSKMDIEFVYFSF